MEGNRTERRGRGAALDGPLHVVLTFWSVNTSHTQKVIFTLKIKRPVLKAGAEHKLPLLSHEQGLVSSACPAPGSLGRGLAGPARGEGSSFWAESE